MRVLGAILLVLALASPVSAKTTASCSVSPNPVQGPAGTVSYQWSTPITGNWTVTVRNTHYPHPQPIGSCSFRVT